ncbi:hypothetical protein ALP38_200031 [Pseudomonas amygdali pv. sesami]|nr:hypothetical protein ALP38_200031 [Pseudomonas amygdali pv. sesami]
MHTSNIGAECTHVELHTSIRVNVHTCIIGGNLMNGDGMATNVRLTTAEQEAIRQKAIEFNKILIKQGKQPLRDSELVHKILEKSVPYARLSESGDVIIDSE